MKQIFLVLMLLIATLNLTAQDVLVRTNGDNINCTVTKIDSTTIFFTIDRNGSQINTRIEKNLVSDIRYGNTGIYKQPVETKESLVYKSDTLPSFSIGLGSGINNFTGLIGLSVGIRFIDKLSIRAGFGTGFWGAKYTGGLKYDMRYNGGWSYGIGYSICPANNTMEMPVFDDKGKDTGKKYTITFLKASTINVTATRSWKIGRRNTLYLDLGYAVALEDKPWKILTREPLPESNEFIYKLYKPGGLIIGFGFTFGLN